MKRQKQTTPLLYALAGSMLCASLAAAVSAQTIFKKYNTDGWKQPSIAVLMQALASQDLSWETANADIDANGLPGDTAPETPPDGQPGTVIPDGSSDEQPDSLPSGGSLPDQSGTGIPDGSSDGQPGSTLPDGTSADPSMDVSTDDPAGEQGEHTPPETGQPTPEATPQPEPEHYEFTDVTKEYFDDALLIGDSRAEGVMLYSGWDNITYYAEGGMTIYNMFKRQVTAEDGNKLSIEDALQKHTFGKIYLEIGINEMGTGTVDSFMEAYESAVNHLRELQPDAIIYVCGIMYVKQSKSESDPIFNNPNIQARNDRIAALADGVNIFYLDINELVTDETGNLNPDYTWDEVHLLGKYDSLWLDYFCSHGIVRE